MGVSLAFPFPLEDEVGKSGSIDILPVDVMTASVASASHFMSVSCAILRRSSSDSSRVFASSNSIRLRAALLRRRPTLSTSLSLYCASSLLDLSRRFKSGIETRRPGNLLKVLNSCQEDIRNFTLIIVDRMCIPDLMAIGDIGRRLVGLDEGDGCCAGASIGDEWADGWGDGWADGWGDGWADGWGDG